MGSRRTRLRSRPEGGLRPRRRWLLERREREGDRPPEGDAAAESAAAGPQPAPAPPPQDERVRAEHAGDDDEHFDEHRWREAGGPEDRARYTCTCGYVWDTAVSASVTCPHCGAAQAW
jgi:DNA-directed RNA polymerase subunit M/transcription elongation factor TFIIS